MACLPARPEDPELPAPAGLASYHVHGHLHGLLQPKELPGYQVDPACPHGAGLMHPVLLGVPARLGRRLLAALMLAALVGWGRLLATVPPTIATVATL